MDSFEPVDIDRDGLGEGYDKWGDDLMSDLERRYNQLRKFNKTLNESTDEATINETLIYVDEVRNDIEELVENQIYDKLTNMFNNAIERFGIENGTPIEPLRKYNNLKLDDDGSLTFIYKSKSKRTVIDLGNINNRIKSPSEHRRLSVAKLK